MILAKEEIAVKKQEFNNMDNNNNNNSNSNNSNKLWILTHHLWAGTPVKVLTSVGLDLVIPDRILCPTKVKVTTPKLEIVLLIYY